MRITKIDRFLILAGAAIGALSGPATWASTVWPSDLSVTEPGLVLMVDGADRNAGVKLGIRLATPERAAFDFGFMNNDSFVSLTRPGHGSGNHAFAGGALVDFTLRNRGADHLFGTADDLLYRLSDSAGYATQDYFAPIPASRSRHPVVGDFYYHDLRLDWDLNHDGVADVRTWIDTRGGKYDGMMPAPLAVPLPAAAWLFGSGLLALAATLRRARQA
jgi:hypothetical protein